MNLINALTFKMDHSMGTLQMLKERRVRRTLPRRNMKGWVCRETSYDDGGWSGGTIERPALRRFMTDIKASRIKIIVVFKIDRLTRSLTYRFYQAGRNLCRHIRLSIPRIRLKSGS